MTYFEHSSRERSKSNNSCHTTYRVQGSVDDPSIRTLKLSDVFMSCIAMCKGLNDMNHIHTHTLTTIYFPGFAWFSVFCYRERGEPDLHYCTLHFLKTARALKTGVWLFIFFWGGGDDSSLIFKLMFPRRQRFGSNGIVVSIISVNVSHRSRQKVVISAHCHVQSGDCALSEAASEAKQPITTSPSRRRWFKCPTLKWIILHKASFTLGKYLFYC